MKIKLACLIMVIGYSIIVPETALAFKVDKMVVVSDEKGNGAISLSNDGSAPLFIQSNIQELTVNQNNEVVRNDYTRKNLSDWKISLTHPQVVLRPGEEKTVGIRSLCYESSCDTTTDLMFMLPFTPSHYDAKSIKSSGIQFNYGFTPIYIIPTRSPNVEYKVLNNGADLIIENKGNTLIYVTVEGEGCGELKQCRSEYMVISGRSKVFNLPENVQSENLNITVSSHDKQYNKTSVYHRSKN
ncbi:hypothetical protein AB8613_14920 [Vibrio sp. BS-M-Sm-2]|uniref:hypothetical protein n=1 Tax=Vibrio sp. BS-M-Sm-2 TaxID=3241167 RepID=UPI003558C709